MTEWYLIDNEGNITRTAYARTKREAAQVFGGRPGTVISALSWKHDYHRWAPVRTVTTDKVQVQERTGGPKLSAGLLGTAHAAQRLGITARRLRHITERLAIQPERVAYGSREIYAYTVSQVEAIRQRITSSLGGTDD